MSGGFDANKLIQPQLSDIESKVPNSRIADITWPALPDARSAQSLAIQFQLNQSQWWQPAQLLKWQLRQLSILVQYAFRNTTFYKQHYQNTKVDHNISSQQWQKLPLVTRDHIQQSSKDLKSENIPPEHGKIFQISTSGSTGKPVDVYKSELNNFMGSAFVLRDHNWHNRNVSGDFAAIRHAPEDKFRAPHGYKQSTWGPALSGIYESGSSLCLDSMSPVSQQLSWLHATAPDYLMTYPSNLSALIEYSLESGQTPNNLEQVLTFGELLPSTLRQQVYEAWKVKLIDMYSCQEAGILALQCPDHDHYHVQSENVLLEVLDTNGNTCSPGETGKVVISSLHNFASPLIRYEVGDYAEVGEPCSCGRGLPVLARIYGRARNMIHYPNGDRSWPYLGGAGNYKKIAPIRQCQIIQTELDILEFHMVVDRPLDDSQQNMLTKRLQQALRYPFIVSFHYHQEIKRSSGGKYEDFICKLKSQ